MVLAFLFSLLAQAESMCTLDFRLATSQATEVSKTIDTKLEETLKNKVLAEGFTQEVFIDTWNRFLILRKDKLKNPNHFALINYDRTVSEDRLFVFGLDGSVQKFKTAHGKGSDPHNKHRAELFGNASGSKRSSVGCSVTGSTFKSASHPPIGIRLHGLDPSNDQLCERAVYMHAAKYTGNASGGRSFGCPTFAPDKLQTIKSLFVPGTLVCTQPLASQVDFQTGKRKALLDHGPKAVAKPRSETLE